MADNEFPDISVGDFAANILEGMRKDPRGNRPALKEATIEAAGGIDVPDVSKVKVDEDFVTFAVKSINPSAKKSKPKPVETISEAKQTQTLIKEFSEIVSRAKVIIEMLTAGTTSVGNIGVNMSGSAKEVKKGTKKSFAKHLRKKGKRIANKASRQVVKKDLQY